MWSAFINLCSFEFSSIYLVLKRICWNRSASRLWINIFISGVSLCLLVYTGITPSEHYAFRFNKYQLNKIRNRTRSVKVHIAPLRGILRRKKAIEYTWGWRSRHCAAQAGVTLRSTRCAFNPMIFWPAIGHIRGRASSGLGISSETFRAGKLLKQGTCEYEGRITNQLTSSSRTICIGVSTYLGAWAESISGLKRSREQCQHVAMVPC